MIKIFLMVWVLFAWHQEGLSQPLAGADSVLKDMQRVADWQLRSWDKEGMRWARSDWTNGACYAGFMALARVAADARYLQAMRLIGEALSWNTGSRRTLADDYCVAQMFSQMYALYRDPAMIRNFRSLADSIAAQPHTESLEWKDNIALREWAWCDALFMGPPAFAYLSKATGDLKYLSLADRLWWKTTDYLYDSTEHLYSRDGRYLQAKEANGKKMFWSRGNGWVMGGLVRMLENMPADFTDRPRWVSLFKNMADRIASLQHADGSWHSALLDSGTYPAKETSGTGFYCYALAWGVNNGLLAYDKYYPVLDHAWKALHASIHADGKLGNVQQIGEKPGAVDDNSTEVYGVGAMLLAGSEMIELILSHAAHPPVLGLYNSAGLDRGEEIAEIPYAQFSAKTGDISPATMKIEDPLTHEEFPYQLEYKGGKVPVNILLQVRLLPGQKRYVQATGKPPENFPVRTFARYVPERADDFAWENDRIAFRMYGKALEGTSEDAYGLDVWVKRTEKMILNERYKRGEYHIDHGDGMDYYHVGYSLGAGNIAPYWQDSIWYSKNYHAWKILDNGPLRSSFQLQYDRWNLPGTAVTVTKTISLDAGSQLSRVEADFHWDTQLPLPVVVGIVKRKEPGVELMNEQQGIMGYWEPADALDGSTGVGSLFPGPIRQMMVKDGHLLTELQVFPGKPVVYYTGAAWDRAGLIRNSGEWFSYLEEFQSRLHHPLVLLWK